jgi:hypothetical protein
MELSLLDLAIRVNAQMAVAAVAPEKMKRIVKSGRKRKKTRRIVRKRKKYRLLRRQNANARTKAKR